MASARSRFIPRSVQRRLREDARDRCSLMGHLIPLDELNTDLESSVLQQHHVVFFTDGGGHEEKNLMLVCPNCHARIHRDAESYPTDKLQLAKRAWIGLKDVVPSHLYYTPDFFTRSPFPCHCRYRGEPRCLHVLHGEGSEWTSHNCCSLCARDYLDAARLCRVWFWVTSLNLRYAVDVPGSMRVHELAALVRECIMRPLAKVANQTSSLHLFRNVDLASMGLAQMETPDVPLPSHLTVLGLLTSAELPLVPLMNMTGVLFDQGPPEPTQPIERFKSEMALWIIAGAAILTGLILFLKY